MVHRVAPQTRRSYLACPVPVRPPQALWNRLRAPRATRAPPPCLLPTDVSCLFHIHTGNPLRAASYDDFHHLTIFKLLRTSSSSKKHVLYKNNLVSLKHHYLAPFAFYPPGAAELCQMFCLGFIPVLPLRFSQGEGPSFLFPCAGFLSFWLSCPLSSLLSLITVPHHSLCLICIPRGKTCNRWPTTARTSRGPTPRPCRTLRRPAPMASLTTPSSATAVSTLVTTPTSAPGDPTRATHAESKRPLPS